jgi:AcrR family transcriptional regulator
MPERSRKGTAPKRGRPGPAPQSTLASRTNDEWSAATIEGLIRLARREFTLHGYAGTTVDRIADQAQLTKGAVYYHFGNKEGLFEAVLRKVQGDLQSHIEARADQSSDPLTALQAGCEAFLELATGDDLRQIVLTDGPGVLGWSRWRAIDAEFGLGSLKQGLSACREAGVLGANGVDLDVLAHWLSGALNESVFLIAESSNRAQALGQARRVLAVALSALAPGRNQDTAVETPVRAPASVRKRQVRPRPPADNAPDPSDHNHFRRRP